MRRLVNYSRASRPAQLWCEVENKFWFFAAKVCRKLIWQPHVRALLEESRLWQEEGKPGYPGKDDN